MPAIHPFGPRLTYVPSGGFGWKADTGNAIRHATLDGPRGRILVASREGNQVAATLK